MNYYIDTEFHEYHKQSKCLGIKIGKPIPTIDLISIGIVDELGRKYYAISKNFNIKDAWNSWQWNSTWKTSKYGPELSYNDKIKEYWLRDNVLKSIFKELWIKNADVTTKYGEAVAGGFDKLIPQIVDKAIELGAFTLKNFTKLIDKYGKTDKQIAEEIKAFIYKGCEVHTAKEWGKKIPINFYGYYADYDHVVLSQLFGKMIDLPKGFPMYCRDLKQMLDEMSENINKACGVHRDITNTPDYPKQENEHNALSDAIWNKKLHKFLDNI